MLRDYAEIWRRCHPERSEGSRPRMLKADAWSLHLHGTRSFIAEPAQSERSESNGLLRMTPTLDFSTASERNHDSRANSLGRAPQVPQVHALPSPRRGMRW